MNRVPKAVQDESLAKWYRALKACTDQETFYTWWNQEGQNACSFCYYLDDDCKFCPLSSDKLRCASEWSELLNIFGHSYSPTDFVNMLAVTKLVESMIIRIQAVKIFNRKGNIVNK